MSFQSHSPKDLLPPIRYYLLNIHLAIYILVSYSTDEHGARMM